MLGCPRTRQFEPKEFPNGQIDRHADRQRNRQILRNADHPRNHRAASGRYPQVLWRRRHVHLRSGLHLDRLVRLQDHLHRRRRRRPALSGLQHRRSRRAERLHGMLLPADEGRAAEQGAEGKVRQGHHQPHDGPRAAQPVLSRLPARRPSDGGMLRRRRSVVGLLSRLARHPRSASAHDRLLPAGGQDADHRRHGLQVLDRAALHLSAQRSQLLGQFPAHDVLGAGRGIRDQPGAREGGRPHPDAPCRPRAECLDG